jgi:hypothetical protein
LHITTQLTKYQKKNNKTYEKHYQSLINKKVIIIDNVFFIYNFYLPSKYNTISFVVFAKYWLLPFVLIENLIFFDGVTIDPPDAGLVITLVPIPTFTLLNGLVVN